MLLVRRTVTFDGAFVLIRVSRFGKCWLNAHHHPLYNWPFLMERTFAIIKPDATAKQYTGKILQRIEEAGFQIRAIKSLRLTREEQRAFTPSIGTPFFKSLTEFMTSGRLSRWSSRRRMPSKMATLMGATTRRRRTGHDP